MIMKRNNIFIFQWAAWLCAILAACSGLEEELPVAGEAHMSGSDTRAELIEYTIDVETAGTLESLVEAGGYSDAQKLVVTGNIGYEDVHYVDVNMPAVEVLDLFGAAYDSELIEGAFLSDSTQIKEIALPGNITYISYKSSYNSDTQSWEYFYPFNCSSVTSIILPESLSKIGYRAFYNCSSLSNIKIPESVTSIGSWAFGNCSSLTSINIPEGVTSIESCVFYRCSSLTSIILPESVTSIRNSAFYDCSSLISINIPESVTSIGYWTFEYCSSLTSINIPESVTSIGYSAFYGCSSLASINIPEGVTSIESSVFYRCSSLTSIILPESVTSIGNSAFYGCSSLTSINIPEDLTSIGNYAFYDCSSLISINIPESVTSIGNYAFYGCSSLISINIPESVTSIGYYAFYNCSSLTSINIPEGLISIGNYAFYGCSSLISINIPESVTSIGYYAFGYCSSLSSINVPESVTSIGNYAFYGCTSLRIIRWNTSCSLPDGFSGSNKLILYNTEDIPSTDGSGNYTTTAEKAVYIKNFASWYNNIWYTIALPFKPTEISHKEKGTIAPFRSGVEGVKNFWLRELTPDGYQNVTEMEPNHAYIIAMPTSTDYSDEYRLNGNVTFSAENVTITWETIPSEGATYTLYPTFETVKKAKDVYALNSEYWMDGYGYGRVFVRSAMDVQPLQAYVKWNDGAATMRSVLPVADGKRTAVRGASSTDEAGSRGAYGQRKPQIDDM
jgi:hypothetical protein